MENTNQELNIPDLPTAVPIQPKAYTTFESVMALVMLPTAFLFNHSVFTHIGGLWGGIFWLFMAAMLIVFTAVKKLKLTLPQKILLGISVLFCFTPLFSANLAVNFFAAVFSFILLFYIAATLRNGEILGKHFIRDLFGGVFAAPFSRFGECPKALLSLTKRAKGGKTLLYILLGLLLALPVTPIIVYLLMSSDTAFAYAVEGFFDSLPDFSALTLFEMAFAIPLAFYLFGMLQNSAEKRDPKPEALPDYRIIPLPASCAAVTPACIFYAAYIAVQLSYLSPAFGGSLPEQFIYSEFARNGFFELCAIAAINLGLILLMQTLTARRENDRRPVALKAYTVVLSVCTLLIIASAMCKMALYVERYGLTQLRVYASWFMILLVIMFVIIILWQFVKLPLWKVVFTAFSIMFGILCFGNVDGSIAKYNIEAYKSGRIAELDIDHLIDLGPAAAEHMAELNCDEFDDRDKKWYFTTVMEDITAGVPLPDYFSIPRIKAENAARSFLKTNP